PKRGLTAGHGALSPRSARGAVSPLGTGRWRSGKTCVRSLCGERAVRELMTVIVLCETNERTGARRRTGSRRLPPVFRRSTSFPSEGPFVLALPERSAAPCQGWCPWLRGGVLRGGRRGLEGWEPGEKAG